MTHEELLNKILMKCGCGNTKALRAVVELHKPDSTGGCNACEQWTNEGAYQLHYPCPTIQAIEKELK
jgi:hypothetical protein